MKTKTLLLGVMSMAFACCTVFSSCSSDNDDNGTEAAGVLSGNPQNVFTGKLPSTFSGYNVNYDAKGRVTSLTTSDQTVTFVYNNGTRASKTDWDVKMINDDCILYIQLNKQGFAKEVYEEYTDKEEENETDTWKFDYNAQGQLAYMYRSEDESVTNIEYTNGDITKVTDTEGDASERDVYTTTIFYTNDTYSSPIDNKGCVMLFDDMFEIDMDEMGPAYIAGLLGHPTKHLPVGNKDDGEPTNFVWKFDTKGYPTFFAVDEFSIYYGSSFSWK